MTGDRKLCDWLAEHVMGALRTKLDPYRWMFPRIREVPSYRDNWNPIDDARDTDRLMTAMRESGFTRIEITDSTAMGGEATIYGDRLSWHVRDPDWKRAVCLAVKAAMAVAHLDEARSGEEE